MKSNYNLLAGRSRVQARNIFKTKLPLYINKDVVIHHVNGNPFDNRFENLLPLTRKQHYQIHKSLSGIRHSNNKKRYKGNQLKQLESLLYLYNEGIFID